MPIVPAARIAEPCPSCSTGATRRLPCIGPRNLQKSPFGKRPIYAWKKKGDRPRKIMPHAIRRRIAFQRQTRAALNEYLNQRVRSKSNVENLASLLFEPDGSSVLSL